jgi:hypothetical protein
MRLQGKTIGYFVAPEVEDLEFWVPVMRLREEGAKVIVIGLTNQTVHGKHGLEMTPDVSIAEAPKADALDAWSFPEDGRPTNCAATRECCNSCAIWMHEARSSLRSVMAAGCPFRRGSCAGAKLQEPPRSRMISPTPAASGSARLPYAMAIWCGAASSMTFPTSAANWLLRWKNRGQWPEPLTMRSRAIMKFNNLDRLFGC